MVRLSKFLAFTARIICRCVQRHAGAGLLCGSVSDRLPAGRAIGPCQEGKWLVESSTEQSRALCALVDVDGSNALAGKGSRFTLPAISSRSSRLPRLCAYGRA